MNESRRPNENFIPNETAQQASDVLIEAQQAPVAPAETQDAPTMQPPHNLPPAGHEHSADAASDKRKTRRRVLGTAGAVIALTVGGIFGVNAMNGETPKGVDTSVEVDLNEEQPKDSAQELWEKNLYESEPATVEAYEIPVGLTPDQFAEKLWKGLDGWEMASANRATFDKLSSDGMLETVTAESQANKEIFADALLAPGWESDEYLAGYAARSAQTNASVLESYLLTSGGPEYNAEDQEAFRRWSEVTSVNLQSESDTGRVIETSVTMHNNADKNRIGSKYHPEQLELNGGEIIIRYTTVFVDGTEKLQSMEVLKHPSDEAPANN